MNNLKASPVKASWQRCEKRWIRGLGVGGRGSGIRSKAKVKLLSHIFLLLSFFFLLPTGLAQETPPTSETVSTLTLEEALTAAADADAQVIAARSDLTAAERELERLSADPLALRIPLLQAEQAVAAASGELESAVLAAEGAVADAYYAALEADDALALAETSLAIAEVKLKATQIRLEAGAATQLDLARAENEAAAAQREVDNTRQSKMFAYQQLASRLGRGIDFQLSDAIQVSEPPEFGAVLAGLPENSQLQAARRAVTLAEAQLETINTAFSARADIEAATDTFQNAQISLFETERSLTLAIRQSYNALVAAWGRYQSAQANLAAAQETLAAQRLRFEAGSISPLELQQAELDYQNVLAQLNSARYDVAQAAQTLEQTLQGGGLSR